MPGVHKFHDMEEVKACREYRDRVVIDSFSGGAWDDLTGLPLDAKELDKARRLEMQYAKDKKVWRKIKRSKAQRQGMRIIKTRWIDINKGDDQARNYRSRFVAKEFNDKEIDGLSAATPPLEALRLLVSEVATYDPGSINGTGKVFMTNDVARAFFEAPMHRDVCIELPTEAMEPGEDPLEWVGKLQMRLYGTKDAATNWQELVAEKMEKIGFKRGVYNPCTYYHAEKRLHTMVHGDDYCSVGERKDIE